MSEQTTSQGFALSVVEKRGEMAITAAAAHAKASVEAKYTIALHRPRKIMEARSAILDACRRERFAEVARYKKPVGKKQIGGKWEQQYIEGFSIRFAETAIQAMKNIDVATSIVWEDEMQRTVHVSVTDLESNLSYGEDITVSKTVERRSLKEGQEKVGERVNSYGDKVYIVIATDDEVANKVAAQRSKVIRNSGLRLIPQDFLEEATEVIANTLEKGGTDPKAEVKKIVDAFNALGIPAGELEKYLTHPLETISKKEIIDLRAVYSTIKDGESSWAEYVGGEQNVPRAEATPGPKVAAFRPAKERMTGPVEAAQNSEEGGDLGPSGQTIGPGSNVVPLEAVKENPPKAAGKTTASPTAATPESTPAAVTNTKTEEPSTPTTTATPEVDIPPSMMPDNWLPTLDIADAAGTLKSLMEWLSTEELHPDELMAALGSRAGKAKTVSELRTPQHIGILKAREGFRVAILTARAK